jgi:hypothetical protein
LYEIGRKIKEESNEIDGISKIKRVVSDFRIKNLSVAPISEKKKIKKKSG